MTPQVEDTLKSLPLRPGVYRMIGPEEVVLYVGAKNLKSRESYFVKNDHSAHRDDGGAGGADRHDGDALGVRGAAA